MKKDSKNSQNDDYATPFKGQQKEKGRNSSSEWNDLRNPIQRVMKVIVEGGNIAANVAKL